MRSLRGRTRTVAALAAATALVLAGCGGDDGADETTDESTATEEETATEDATATEEMTEEATASETAAAGGEVATGRGVTAEPCPDGNPDRGCIYLGIISDLTVGPFAPLGAPITEADEAFWTWVNDNGGIGEAYDVNVTEYTRDSEYNPQVHAEAYEEIRGEVLAIAQSLGTSQTLSVIEAMDTDNMVAGPMTWWSGWNYNDLILQSGSSYCAQGMNGIDYVADEVSSVAIVKFPGDYGEDWAAGVRLGAEAAGVEVLGEDIEQVPISAGGDVAAAVGELAGMDPAPDAIFMATGPSELGEIAGGLAQQGYQGRYVGSNPTYNGALLDSPVGPVLEASYVVMGAFEAYNGESVAHDNLRAAIPEPANDGATYGWMMSYPLLSVLEAAYESGDLTPEGVRAAAGSATVDYEGALPELDLSAEGADQQVRQSSISAPDPEGVTGLTTLEVDFTGPTAEEYPFDEPCFSLN
ncbi:ABC transporter substrate-binding protein [Salsipaludibacter albus]|uniref:ABC transporter substrate-binding protein n=1 Tax=Salsipaludibacter albus TaxID=2849650 RepID=UPI001EE4E642|nr:ABC transporter substrate-binding protein [Salsipaludibacter albus]MBY5161976.1 ABC transporter substrate-binding protein [Salsipaludibacter albus]